MRCNHFFTKSGFTLVEVLITIGITGLLLGLTITRYQHGNDDGALNRDAARISATLRLAQQQTASGEGVSYCAGKADRTCNQDTDCSSPPTCVTSAPPEGGMSMLFSCTSTYPNTSLYFAPLASSTFFMYGDRTSCATPGDCFPPGLLGAWSTARSDGFITSYVSGVNFKGDPKVGEYSLDARVDIRDLRLTVQTTGETYRCSGQAPWKTLSDPTYTHGDTIAADYPLQGLVQFAPPTGRNITISDNVSTVDPTHKNLWEKLEVLVGVKNRITGCRTVSITREGTISNTSSSNCDFNP